MKRLLLGSLLMCGSLQATDWCDWFHGWVDVSGVYGNRRLDIHETQIDPLQYQATYVQLNSYGYEGEIGFIFPLPFYVDFQAGYRDLFNTRFSQESSGGSTGPLKLYGHEWSYRVDIGYAFNPLCNWSIYPFASYNYDQISVMFANFPTGVMPPVIITDLELKAVLLMNGPSCGIGTNYSFPFDLFVWFEFDWQWRQLVNRSRNTQSIELPLIETQTGTSISREAGWLDGPRFRLGIDYFFYRDLFLGIEGVYSQLYLSSKGFQHSKNTNTTENLVTHEITQQISFQDTDLNRFESKEFQVKATVGFVW
jgi:hypothetical protein